jgi:hypothetical protein
VSDHNIYRWAGQLLSAVGKLVPEHAALPTVDDRHARDSGVTPLRIPAG